VQARSAAHGASTLTERLGLSSFAQRTAPTSGNNKPRKRDPLLKEQARDEIERPAERLRRHGLETVSTTLCGHRYENAADRDGEQGKRSPNASQDQAERSNQE